MSLASTWEWKREVESPLLSPNLVGCEDVWLFGEEVVASQDEDEGLSQPVTRAQVAAKLLDYLDEIVKEEPFSDFLEERVDLPIFEDLPPAHLTPKYKSLDTQTLIQEFDYVYGEVELNNGSFLTPPQSPPAVSPSYNPEPSMGLLSATFPGQTQDLVFLNTLSAMPQKSGYMASNVDDMILMDVSGKSFLPATPQPDVATEMAAVDELLRIRAEDMDVSSDPWETSNVSSPSDSSESESVPSPAQSCSENSNSGDVSNDPEWVPEVEYVAKAVAPKRRRAKPYGRPVEDKKLRKKEQNKNAATRYRQKKKQEVEVILDEEKILEDKNDDLKEKVTDLQREIRYLKGLMRDLFKAKGVLQ